MSVNYKNMTKEDLLKILEQKDQELNEQTVTIERLSEEVKEFNAKGAGWLVETPNPLYDGKTGGIQFVMGQAFIHQGQTLPQFEIEPMKDGQLEKYSKADQEAIKERMKITAAERAAKIMENEFGYKVTYFDGTLSADEEMQKLVSSRTLEYRNALQAAEAKEKAIAASGVMNFMGGN